MKFFKFITPFIVSFVACIILSFKTWNGDFIEFSLSPARSVLFVAMGFTMLISDMFLKYLVGKQKILYVWIIEAILLGILCIMIIPKIYTERII